VEGYSGTPLWKKLGLKPGMEVWVQHAPEGYLDALEHIPEEVEWHNMMPDKTVDFAHVFSTKKEQLEANAIQLKDLIHKSGILWISWPKKTSKIQTDLNRDWIRQHFLQIGLVDVKVAAIDENWSGLKFVYRLKDR
jgi:hypothetical protein